MAWAVAGAREDEAAEQPAVRGSTWPSNSNASSHRAGGSAPGQSLLPEKRLNHSRVTWRRSPDKGPRPRRVP